MGDEFRQSFPLLPGRSEPWIGISKPVKSGIKKFIGRRSAAAGALSVEGPAKHELRRTILFSGHPPKPMINESGLPDTSPGNDRKHIYLRICPGGIQKSNILHSTKNIASGNG